MYGQLAAVVISQNPEWQQTVAKVLKDCGLDVVFSDTVRESAVTLSNRPVCLTICEETLSDGDFRDVLRQTERSVGSSPVIVISRVADWDRYLEAVRQGAFDYIGFPCHPAEVERVVRNGLLEYLHTHNYATATRA
jgi:DNA-binding NtrC family response regulator